MIFLRCALVWSVATTVAVPSARWLLTSPSGPGLEGLLVRTCSVALAACLVWGWFATSATVLDAMRHRPRGRRGVPAGLRRLVWAACGVALVAGASPALATPGPVVIADHSGTSAAPVVVVPALAAPRVVVHRGDTLWAIAARQLPTNATPVEVSGAWQKIYARNRAVIGSDPDLLLPGQRLELPR